VHCKLRTIADPLGCRNGSSLLHSQNIRQQALKGSVSARHGDSALAVDNLLVNKGEAMTLLTYTIAAFAEIAGCFAFWAWMRANASAVWLIPGTMSLILFAWLLTKIDAEFAGRAYAAYGGVYIGASLIWLWLAESKAPDRWDLTGAAICLIGASVIIFGPRTA